MAGFTMDCGREQIGRVLQTLVRTAKVLGRLIPDRQGWHCCCRMSESSLPSVPWLDMTEPTAPGKV